MWSARHGAAWRHAAGVVEGDSLVEARPADECEIGLACTLPAAGFEGVARSIGVQVHLTRFRRL